MQTYLNLDDTVRPLLGCVNALRVPWTVLAGAASRLLSAAAEGAVDGVDARETGVTLAHLARVGQADGVAAADVTVGAAVAVETQTRRDVGYTVGSFRQQVTDGAGRAVDVVTGQGHADGSSWSVFALLIGLALPSLAGGCFWHADLADLFFADGSLGAFLTARA